jgi:hypothetical protein
MAIARLIEPRARDLGGFSVRRALPHAQCRTVGPFIFFDQLGPLALPPGEGMDVRPHPHIGLATVTYLFEGALEHRDSLGNVQVIRPGDVNWMTAGSGIVHSERSPVVERAGGVRMHGIQTWVALPREAEESEPAFHHHPAASLPAFVRDGAEYRLIAGAAFDCESPVRVFAPMFYLAVRAPARARVWLPDGYAERAVYVAAGAASLAAAPISAGQLATFEADVPVCLDVPADSLLLLFGGAPLDGERFIWWNFVSSSQQRIERAKEAWVAQEFAAVPGETEFIPLP